MTKQTINLGATPNGAGGDTPRSAFTKVQANFDEIYAALGAPASGALPAALPVADGGTGGTTQATARQGLGLKSAALADITGVVSFAGGAPTGAVMEQGSNANGHYIKFACGFMICWLPNILATFQNPSNLGFVWTYPAVFIGYIAVTATCSGLVGISKTFSGPHAYSLTERTASLSAFSLGTFVAADASSMGIGAVATGRWY